jgi:carbon storage regulator CsrA
MLVLTRKQGEQIRIGDDVVITVVRTKGKGVRLGIQAPAHVPVLRGEIARAMSDAANQQSSEAADEHSVEHEDEEWPSGGELYKVIQAGGLRTSPGDMLGARGGRGLLRQMVATRGV